MADERRLRLARGSASGVRHCHCARPHSREPRVRTLRHRSFANSRFTGGALPGLPRCRRKRLSDRHKSCNRAHADRTRGLDRAWLPCPCAGPRQAVPPAAGPCLDRDLRIGFAHALTPFSNCNNPIPTERPIAGMVLPSFRSAEIGNRHPTTYLTGDGKSR